MTLLKGAIVGVDIFNPLASVVIFQYNPATLTRTLAPRTAGADSSARAEPLRLTGPPEEDISVEIEIDATDQLEVGDALASTAGIHPQLASLEMLVYPKTASVILNTALMLAGTIEVVPPEAPLTLFVWGPHRVVPVRITSFSITEEAYDSSLSPIRAKVTLGLRVLTYNDLPITNPGHALFLVHQVIKEAFATMGSVGNLAAALGGDVDLL